MTFTININITNKNILMRLVCCWSLSYSASLHLAGRSDERCFISWLILFHKIEISLGALFANGAIFSANNNAGTSTDNN